MSPVRVPLYARDWLLKDEAGSYVQKGIERWHGRLDGATFVTYYSRVYPFFHSIGKSPDEALEWARQAKDRYEVLDAIQSWVNGLKGRYATKRLAYAIIRSYFMHNRVDIAPDRGYIIRGDEEPVERKLTIENVKTLVGLAVQPWRSALLVKWQGLLDNEGVIYISNHHAETIVKAVKENADICRLSMPGRKKLKNKRGFYTFIASDALGSLREYFEKLRGYPKPGEPIWTYTRANHLGEPITKRGLVGAWMFLLRRSKLIPAERSRNRSSRYGYNIHNTRDLAISLLATVPDMKDHCVEYWAGHEIDPLHYKDLSLHPQFLEEQYRLAIPYLNILSVSQTEQENLKEVERLREEVRELKGQFETILKGKLE
jgi:hypothetical protein